MLSWLLRRRGKIDIFRALDAFRRELERPRDDQRDGEADRDQHDHQPYDPIWNLQERENLRGNLNQEPADDRVSDRYLVNVPPLQLSKEFSRIHGDIIRLWPGLARRDAERFLDRCRIVDTSAFDHRGDLAD